MEIYFKYSTEEEDGDGEMVMGQQTAASVHTPVSVSRIKLLIQPGPGARCAAAAEESNWSLCCYLLISSCICFLLSLSLACSVHTNPPTPTLTRPN